MTAAPELRTAIIIPARYASTRYPGKPLVSITGCDGVAKTLIRRSWEAARAVRGVDAIYVATDDLRIEAEARSFGADAVMTSEQCANGTERCADAVTRLGLDHDVIVNLQGDAPLTSAHFVEALIGAMANAHVATPVIRVTAEHYAKLVDDEKAGRVGGTSAVFARDGRALYFSKRLIPYLPAGIEIDERLPLFLHLGVYAYSRAALAAYAGTTPSMLENLEGLEQLRFLDIGVDVRVVEVTRPDWELWELNNPSDLPHIETALRAMGRS